MPVYVDTLVNWGWKLGESCHLIADTLDELHAFASKIGMKREWLQISANHTPHYDLTASRRKVAVDKGAIELPRRDFVAKMKEIKNQTK